MKRPPSSILVLVAVGAIGLIFWLLLPELGLPGRSAGTSPAEPAQTTAVPVQEREVVTHRDPQYGFEFKYPATYNLIDFSSPSVPARFDSSRVNIHLTVDRVQEAPVADSPCSTASPKAYEDQQQLFESAPVGGSLDPAFRITDYKVQNTKILINPHGAKVAYGIDICQGLAGENDLGRLRYVAIAFHRDVRISLSVVLTAQQSGNVRVKDLESVAVKIADSTVSGKPAEIYRDFLNLLRSLKLF